MNRLEGNPRIKTMILEVVGKQILENDPPETKQTFDRLIEEGLSDEEARRLIGSVVAIEVFGILKNQKVLNLSSFLEALKRLPELPVGQGSDPG